MQDIQCIKGKISAMVLSASLADFE